MANTTYINKNIKSLLDLTVELYGDARYAFKVIEDNIFLTGIQDTISVGMNIIYDDSLVYFVSKVFKRGEIQDQITSVKTVTIGANQSIYDMAIQMYGNIESVFTILKDNLVIDNLNNTSIKGIEMKYSEQAFALTEYFKINSIKITTGIEQGRAFDDSFDYSFN